MHFEESGFSRIDHGVEAIPSFQALVYRSHRIAGKPSNIKDFAYTPRIFGAEHYYRTILPCSGISIGTGGAASRNQSVAVGCGGTGKVGKCVRHDKRRARSTTS